MVTLTYFDLYGKAEAIRMLLTHAKTNFTDNRVTGESWAAYKASGKCANGQVPVLEVTDDAGVEHYLNQSQAILRFLGKQSGYYSSDPFAAHKADAIMDTYEDFMNKSPKTAEGKPLMYGMFGDAAMPEESVTQMAEHRAKLWEAMAALLGASKYFGGDTPSIADFVLLAGLYSWERNTKGKELQAHVYTACSEGFAKFDTLSAWADMLSGELKDYIEARPGGTI